MVASFMAMLLIAAAGVVYLQSGSGGGGGNDASFAAISQSIARHATHAAGGNSGAYDRLERDLQQLNSMRAAGGDIPGRAAQWDALDQAARNMLAEREVADVVSGAARFADEHVPLMVQASDELLSHTSSTAEVQAFQDAALRLQVGLQQLATGNQAAADAVAEELAALRSVTAAFAGEESELDVVPLDDAAREVALVPVISELAEIESRATAAIEASGGENNSAALAVAVGAAADDLLASAFQPGQSGSSGGALSIPWIPIGLLGAALLMLLALLVMQRKSAGFEKTSVEMSAQNERNQQAILRLLDELGSLADGDLTVEATVTEDITGAIADSINYAIEKLRELVATINDTAIMVDSAAKQTESTAGHMAKAAENQSREISAATESIVSMAGSIEEVSGNAERSSDVARHSVEVAHKGGEAVRRTIDGMNTIRETIQETSKRIKRLGESSQEIGNIVELINDIAEQTNILALNASIQASMAGEAGRGFAVVADEVQRLAERSTNATKQIEVLVRTIQADTNEAVVSMERSTTDVVGGALLAENAGAALDEIEQVSNQIANLVQNISGSARQQAGSAADVTRRTTKLKEISDQTGKATTATAAAISKLSELASQLRQTVAGFTLPSAALQSSPLSGAPSVAPPPEEMPLKDQATG